MWQRGSFGGLKPARWQAATWRAMSGPGLGLVVLFVSGCVVAGGAPATRPAAVEWPVVLTAEPADPATRPAGQRVLRPLRPGTYTAESPSLDRPAVVLRGLSGVTVDFSGVVLRGASADALPDQREGLAVLIEDCTDVTVRGLAAHGYRVGILARNSPGLTLTRNDLSDNYAPRLYSTPEAEDLRDWLSYHHNDHDEWLRYGAAIYLVDCPYPTVSWNLARGGQNGLMMNRVERGLIHSNTFHFLSGVGIGMYRSSFNAVMHNRLDFCVRGFSHGVYRRGQDSAAILVYEQSCNNLFAYNSATHSGDGFFLWAGQTTMDHGWGGSNDNVLYGNDFSHAPTNGVEATFSRNYIVANQIDDCDHGIWAGYSFETVILGNTLAGNRIGVAIEHGQENVIAENVFTGNATAIRLWAREREPDDWGYVRVRDTRSRDTLIESNRYEPPPGREVDVLLQRTTGVRLAGVPQPRVRADALSSVEPSVPMNRLSVEDFRPSQLPGALDPFLPASFPRGVQAIVMTEWGPYDFREPRLVRRGEVVGNRLELELLGPPGRGGSYRVTRLEGAALSASSGRFPAKLVLTLPMRPSNVVLDVETTLGGQRRSHRFMYRHLPLDWQVRFFTYPAGVDLTQGPLPLLEALSRPPVLRERVSRLVYRSVPPRPGVPASHYITVAETPLALPPGRYELAVVADDGVRVFLDGRVVLEEWRHQAPTRFTVPLDVTGFQRLRVEHFQITGAAALEVTLTPLP